MLVHFDGSTIRSRFVALIAALCIMVGTPAQAASNAALIDAFNKTMFASEYSLFHFGSGYVRKFATPVRLYVGGTVTGERRRQVQEFALSLNDLIDGLRVILVNRPSTANFVVHLVRRTQYEQFVREQVVRTANARVRGRCMVQAKYNRSGIWRSDAVVVADEGDALFNRCMTEEILQGLGPLNDDPSLHQSMFNDSTSWTEFRRFDRLLLNMLYDKRLKPGMSQDEANSLLPAIIRDVRRSIESG